MPDTPDRDKQPAGQGPADSQGAAPGQQETSPAQEWGERQETGKTIGRGGKEEGTVPGTGEGQA